jgi:hypothetical protein
MRLLAIFALRGFFVFCAKHWTAERERRANKAVETKDDRGESIRNQANQANERKCNATIHYGHNRGLVTMDKTGICNTTGRLCLKSAILFPDTTTKE